MTILSMVLKEIRHRPLGFALGLLSVTAASAVLVGSLLVLELHDLGTVRILEQKQAELETRMADLQEHTRKAMLKLGFNLVILPEDQNLGDWYSEDYGTKTMPEWYVDTLAASGIITVRHFLPVLQQKIYWKERGRNIILVGTRGEVPNLFKDPVKPMVEPVPPGIIILGYELHTSLGIGKGDIIRLSGRPFRVSECYTERGSKDDITAWIHLAEAQDMFGKRGRINAILALECLCAGFDALPGIRNEIEAILPGTQVIERGSIAVARAEARFKVQEEARTALEEETENRERLREERERFAGILIPLVMTACAVWIAFLGIQNVRSRREEIGILRAVGVPAKRIFLLFLLKHLLTGISGGFMGFVAGLIAAANSGIAKGVPAFEGILSSWPGLLALSVGGAVFLAVAAGWIPTLIAATRDPAEVLRGE